MIPLRSLGDELQFELSSSDNIILESKLNRYLRPKDNLIWRAAESFYQAAKIEPSVKIKLIKKIPLGAGLGGGSSNAATTLMALNWLYKKPLSEKKLITLGSQLGSDIPFFFCQKSAFVEGRGEKVVSAPFSPSGWFVVINPGFSIETRSAYRRWEELVSLTKYRGNVRKNRFFSICKNWEAMKEFCENDFQKVIYPAYPILEKAHKKLIRLGADSASLSGSGPSLFGIFQRKDAAKKAAHYFVTKKWLAWVTEGA